MTAGVTPRLYVPQRPCSHVDSAASGWHRALACILPLCLPLHSTWARTAMVTQAAGS